MPDLQSELSKLAHAWEHHEQIIRTPNQTTKEKTEMNKTLNYTHTGVLTHDTFGLIKDNPCMFTPASAADFLETQGHKNNSAHAIITQMRKNGMVKLNTAGQIYTEMDAYKPFANPYTVTKKKLQAKGKAKVKALKAKSAAKEQAQAWAGIAALQPATTPKKETTKLTAKDIIEQLNVTEAYSLYVALGKMFGGAK